MILDEMNIDKIEIENCVGENYPKGWKFIDSTKNIIKRVWPYSLPNISHDKELESTPLSKVASNQKIIDIYGWENDYGIANIGFIVKEQATTMQ